MKKTIILFTILSIGLLNGMETEPSYETLPKELKQEIINTALATSKSVDEAINTLKTVSALQGIQFDKLFDLKDFTKLVHMLADKFNTKTELIAEKFKTPVAEEYVRL